MSIIEFLRSLSWEMNLYEVLLLWKWKNQCPVCKKYFETEDDEYSCEGNTLADYRNDSEMHLTGYPNVYETPISQCEIVIDCMKIIISHSEYDGDIIKCADCEEAEKFV